MRKGGGEVVGGERRSRTARRAGGSVSLLRAASRAGAAREWDLGHPVQPWCSAPEPLEPPVPPVFPCV